MEISSYAYTSRGHRDNNEDYFGYFQTDSSGVWVVADGLGGHACGEIASKLAAGCIIDEAKNCMDFSDDAIVHIINNANKIVVDDQESNPLRKGMRTTIVAAFINGRILKYVHAGDSRFYYFKNNLCVSQSLDHTVSQMSVQLGEITASQVRFHADRNKLLKVLGSPNDLVIDSIDEKIKLERGDAFLLCTDGFWELVYEQEMEIDLLKSNNPQKWLESMLFRLLKRMPPNSDNFTAVCCYVL